MNEYKVRYTVESDGFEGSPEEASKESYLYLKKLGFK